MDIDSGTMAAMTLEGWDELVNRSIPDDECAFFNMTSEELYRCIDADSDAYPFFPIGESPFRNYEDLWEPDSTPDRVTDEEDLKIFQRPSIENQMANLRDFGPQEVKAIPSYDSFHNLPDALKICINPRTLQPSLFLHTVPEEEIKPYHPTQDHDYMKIDSEDSDNVEVKEEIDDGEPVVDVWKIENFSDEQISIPNPVPKQLPTYKQILRERTRRTSKRTADIKRREQARKISHAVHAVLNIKKPVSGRQYKNKLKNSVETTPSQSDIEEWHSHAVRPMYTRITKKKTSKGRIDHSESERNRREILRKKFSALSNSIPIEFLRGEKASSQISKQKILNGAKSYIAELFKYKSNYRSMLQQNRLLQDLWQKRHTSKSSKSVKKLK